MLAHVAARGALVNVTAAHAIRVEQVTVRTAARVAALVVLARELTRRVLALVHVCVELVIQFN